MTRPGGPCPEGVEPMADWWYAKDGQQRGPVTSSDLARMAQAGELKPDDLVFGGDAKDWIAASKIKGLFPAAGGGNRPVPVPGRPGEDAAFAFEGSPVSPGGADVGGVRRPSISMPVVVD